MLKTKLKKHPNKFNKISIKALPASSDGVLFYFPGINHKVVELDFEVCYRYLIINKQV